MVDLKSKKMGKLANTKITTSFSVSHPDREFVARDSDSNSIGHLELFSACQGNGVLDLEDKAKGYTFELCQAGYNDRKVFYDSRTG